MSKFSVPGGVWSRSATVCTTAVIVAPLVILALSRGVPGLAQLTASSAPTVNLVGLVASLLLHLHWRLTRTASTAWLCAGVALVSLQGLTVAVIAQRTSVAGVSSYLAAASLVVALLLVLLAWFPPTVRGPAWLDPLGVGLTLGALVAACHLVVLNGERSWALPPGAGVPSAVVLVASGAALAQALPRRSDLPPWAQVRFQVAIVVSFLWQALALQDESFPLHSDLVLSLGLLSGLVVAVLTSTTSLALLRLGIRDQQRMVSAVRDRLDDLEESTRADRERMHEVMGSIAGIASATELMSSPHVLTAEERPELERMVTHEVARLHRMLHNVHPPRAVDIALDDVLQPLVVGHRAQGNEVRWAPDGRCVSVVPDALAQAVSVLLANAARHAPGSPVEIRVTDEPGWVMIRVTDEGPGVSPSVADAMFDWGARSGTSSGSGIGLHLARRMLVDGTGRLTYDPAHRPGASFVVGVRRVVAEPSYRALP
ncbi:HAMP domain-containing sensor histidine kinase [Nocardioides sp. W7]|uniref:sensor histidine kinase n=1 Tax=Nocardioides sp. W7 TaxID=2931390 RepID=UPI001FD24A47|nr:HAMP domain-containing sensor histidine kinase [Nocardioides sp. W7]